MCIRDSHNAIVTKADKGQTLVILTYDDYKNKILDFNKNYSLKNSLELVELTKTITIEPRHTLASFIRHSKSIHERTYYRNVRNSKKFITI